MTPRELKATMRERSQALKERMRAAQRVLRARVAAQPAVKKERARRRLKQALTAAVLLLLLLFIRCDCGPAPVVPAAPKDAGVVEVVKPKVTAVMPKKGPLTGAGQQVARPQFQGDAPPSPGWLDEFRLQVAARSPRLAACFSGSERPGALRWTAAVDAKSGAVSDHVLEGIGVGGDLPRAQRDCAVKVLSAPVYRLSGADSPGTPSRVSLVIEF